MDPKQNDHKPLEQVVNFVEEDEFEEFENEGMPFEDFEALLRTFGL